MKRLPLGITRKEGLPYSSALEIKGTIISFSGVIPHLDENKKPVSLTLEEQTRQVLGTMRKLLTDCGLSFDHMFDVMIFLHGGMDASRTATVNTIYCEELGADGVQDMPDRAFYGVYALPFGVDIEIKFKAVKEE